MRIAVIGLMVGCLMATAGCTPGKKPAPVPPPAGSSGIVMKLSSAKAEYQRDEPVTLKVELINGEAGECRVVNMPEGGVTFVSMTRDMVAVIPGLAGGSYIDGMSSFLKGGLVALAPAKGTTFDLASAPSAVVGGANALRISTLDADDSTALTIWPVGEPGKYEISARYVAPPIADPPGVLCRASGDPVTVTFTVKGA